MRRNVILWGGGQYPNFENETWEWNGSSWVEIPTVDRPPIADWGAYMVTDAARDRVVLFAEGQTWIWNGYVWNQLEAIKSPPNRYSHAMAIIPFSSSSPSRTASAGRISTSCSSSREGLEQASRNLLIYYTYSLFL